MNKNNEFDLFRQNHSGVIAFAQTQTLTSSDRSIDPTALNLHSLTEIKAHQLSIESAHMLKPEEVVSFKRDSLQDSSFRKLRLGKYDIEARLDLHQFALEAAREEVIRYLKECLSLNIRSLIIVHGKGERTTPQAELKSYICQWLEQIKEVQGIHSAQRHQGGAGAVYVLLKKRAEKVFAS